MILVLNRDNEATLHQQICDQMRQQILSGRLPGGYRIPSTRTLTREYGISRNVFLGAFEQLLAEAYLVTLKGRGTFVSDKIRADLLRRPQDREPAAPAAGQKRAEIDFSIGIPDFTQIPLGEWGSSLRKAVSELKPAELGYGESHGTKRLQEALERHLLVTRGMHFSGEQVFVTSGSYQALLLAVMTALSEAGSGKVVIENPSYSELAEGILQTGASLLPAKTDDHGLIPEKIPSEAGLSLVCTTPSHLFPGSAVFPIHRRLELCRMADDRNFYILENEFEGDIRLTGTPIPAMQSLNEERIFHMGTFSQILYPAVRVGYLIAPPRLADKVGYHYRRQGYGVPVSVQNGLALMIEEGRLQKHNRKMIRRYKEKQDLLAEALQKSFGDDVILKGLDTGRYITASFKNIQFSKKTAEKLEKAGFRADYEFRHYWPPGSREEAPGILLGFGNLTEEEIKSGVMKLRKTLIE